MSLTLSQIAEIAYNTSTSELNASLPSNPPQYQKLWNELTDSEKVAPTSNAKGILESAESLVGLAAWAAGKHSDTGYGQGDFLVGNVAFQAACITLRPFYAA